MTGDLVGPWTVVGARYSGAKVMTWAAERATARSRLGADIGQLPWPLRPPITLVSGVSSITCTSRGYIAKTRCQVRSSGDLVLAIRISHDVRQGEITQRSSNAQRWRGGNPNPGNDTLPPGTSKNNLNAWRARTYNLLFPPPFNPRVVASDVGAESRHMWRFKIRTGSLLPSVSERPGSRSLILAR